MSDGEQLVAKRFFQLNDEADPVSISENLNEVQSELLRLAWGRWFLNAFYQFCKQRKEVNVDEALSFAEAFLAEEVDNPSTASGVEKITGEGTGLTWLVERKRPTTVTKFSGTLVHTSARRDLRSMTVCAFAHFVFGFSNKTMVFADLQGTPAPVRGVDGLILFDVMTHTVEGNSGVGDFGKRGIRTFMHDHQCNVICTELGLSIHYPLQSGGRVHQNQGSDVGEGDEEDSEEDQLGRSDDDESDA
ncbi:kinase-like domain-containing protein [Mycena maculata]|uniref:Kinase-like domain-containing protein n=1 Tax=Mycena maculata TaxID=230809 RepID=A0AAD7JMB1_9AGAR|nr:kinase-like domain-containing protein [Mycena maculata]